MMVIAQSAFVIATAQVVAVFFTPLLDWFYALIVFLVIVFGFRARCPWYTRLTLLLFSGYVAENQDYLWNFDPYAMGMVHFVIGASIFTYCKTKSSQAHMYIGGIVCAKVIIDLFYYANIVIPGSYAYHAALNGLSIVSLVWFVNLSIARRERIAAKDERIDPILLKAYICLNQIRTTLFIITGKGSRL